MAEFVDGFGSPPQPIDVYRLGRCPAMDAVTGQGRDEEYVVAVKLTDECVAALTSAHRKKQRLKLTVDNKGGDALVIGDTTFRFSRQRQAGPPTDAIYQVAGVGFKPINPIEMKYTIQATDNSFEETRVKTQKLMEEEKSRGAKDVNMGRGSAKKSGGSSLLSGHGSAVHVHRAGGGTRMGTPTQMAGGSLSANASPNTGPGAANAARSTMMSASMKADLMRKKLRERVIHIVVTARYKDIEEIIGRLRKDGLPHEQDSTKAIENIISEVSETTESGRIILKPAFNSEVNPRWAWFTSEEKAFVRQTTQSAHSTSTSFAPSRKSGVERMVAPTSVAADSRPPPSERSSSGMSTTSNSPDGVPPAPVMSSEKNRDKNKEKEKNREKEKNGKLKDVKVKEDVQRIIKEKSPLVMSPRGPTKRKAHTAPEKERGKGPSYDMKRPREESASPPEDPIMASVSGKRFGSSSSSSSSASSVSSDRPPIRGTSTSPPNAVSLSNPPSPLTDWTLVYPELTRMDEADSYYATYTSCYAEYAECYAGLQNVAEEFAALERELQSVRGTREAAVVEQRIQDKYSQYEQNTNFVKMRAKHANLRCKLDVISRRLENWESVVSRS